MFLLCASARLTRITVCDVQYEFSAYEFGTRVPSIAPGAFIPIENLGTTLVNGKPDKSTCVTGFDNAA
jgi:hypothetical protein